MLQQSFVTTKICLLGQKFCHDKHTFVADSVCRDKTFVATKMLLVAAPASDTILPSAIQQQVRLVVFTVQERL